MIPDWPAELPQHVDRDGFEHQAPDGRLRSRTSTGPGKSRLRSRAVAEPITCKMRVTGAQLRLFRQFLADDLAGGTVPFTFPDPYGGLRILVQFGENLPRWTPRPGDNWDLLLPLQQLWTGGILIVGVDLPAGYAYVVQDGAPVIHNGLPVIAPVTP